MSAPKSDREGRLSFETLKVRKEQAVLFVEISAPPMNLNGPELVGDLASLIQQAEADDDLKVIVFKSADPDYFISHVDVTRIKENREAAAKLAGEERRRHKAPFPKGTGGRRRPGHHSTSIVRGGHGRCQGWYPPGSIRRTRASSGAGVGRRGSTELRRKGVRE